MDKLAAMKVFVEIVEHGSLTAAATSLDRAPPTIVRTLATLEGELGTRLLTRTTRRMTLTEEGRVYLDRCRRILADIDEAERAIAADGGEPRGEIRMTAPVLFGQRHVMPALADFVSRYVHVRLELLLLDRVVNLVEEGLDLGVRIGTLGDSSMIAIPVGRMRRVVVASSDYLEEVGVPQHPDELEGHSCVVFRGLTAGSNWFFEAKGHRFGVSVRSRFVCNQAAAAVDACAAGLGFGSFLHYQVEPLLDHGGLKLLLEAFETPALPVNLVYPDARLMSPRLRTLVDWMKETLRSRLAP